MSIAQRQRLGVTLAAMLSVLAATAPLAAQPAADSVARIAVEDEPAGAALRLLDEAGSVSFPIAIRVELDPALSATAIDVRIAPIEQRSLPLWLAIPAPDTDGEVGQWRTRLRVILGRPRSTLAILEVMMDKQPSSLAVFAMQVAATETRARRGGVQLALGGAAMADPMRRSELYSPALAPYVDVLAISGSRDEVIASWLRLTDPSAGIALRSPATPPGPQSSRRVVDEVVSDFDTEIAVRAWHATDLTAGVLRALVPLSALLTHPVSQLDPASVGLRLTMGQQDVTATVRHRLLFDTRTFSTYLVYWGEPAALPLGISLTLPIEGVPASTTCSPASVPRSSAMRAIRRRAGFRPRHR